MAMMRQIFDGMEYINKLSKISIYLRQGPQRLKT